jgi:Cu2+-exporting ATPase
VPVIACPHALGLAIPLVVSIATERAARGGVLIKDRLALESMRTVGAVLFYKTGTLTKGEPTVTAEATARDRTEDEVLAMAATADSDSEHPLARAIVDAARRRGLTVPASSDFTSSPAVGVTATVDGRQVRVGGPRPLEEAGEHELPEAGAWREEGPSSCTSSSIVPSPARSRCPTRSARSPGRPSTPCISSASRSS